MPLVRPLFSWPGAFLWLVTVVTALVLAGMHWSELTESVVDRVLAPQNLLLLWLSYPLVKALHELGHGFATRAWGGEVHEMGIMFLVFMPVPYVDASAASAFRDRRKRMALVERDLKVARRLAPEDPIVARCLEEDTEKRYSNAGEVLEALEAAGSGYPGELARLLAALPPDGPPPDTGPDTRMTKEETRLAKRLGRVVDECAEAAGIAAAGIADAFNLRGVKGDKVAAATLLAGAAAGQAFDQCLDLVGILENFLEKLDIEVTQRPDAVAETTPRAEEGDTTPEAPTSCARTFPRPHSGSRTFYSKPTVRRRWSSRCPTR